MTRAALPALLALLLSVRAVAAEPDEAALEAEELAAAPADELAEPGEPAAVQCPEGASNVEGRCLETATALRGSGAGSSRRAAGGFQGEAAAEALLAVAGLAMVAAALRKKGLRKLLPLAALAACATLPESWDDAASDDPPADAQGRYLNVRTAESGLGVALRLDHQASLAPSAPAFSLSLRSFPGAVALRRAATACGDRLTPGSGEELFGYAAGGAEDGTAPLVELLDEGGCAQYASDPEQIAALLEQGYSRGATLGRVWPPGWGDAAPAVEPALRSGAACTLPKNPALILYYTGVGGARNDALIAGCPGEVVEGEKHPDGPLGAFRGAAAHALGGRTAYVYSNFGNELLDLLDSKGAAGAAASIKAKLAAGYDYVVIDEITTNPRWADDSVTGKRFRQMMLQIPPRKLIAYISLDLTMKPGGAAALWARRWLLRSLRLRARALAYELYLHTGQVMAGGAPAAFRTAAYNVALAVKGLPGAQAINVRAITVLGVSLHSAYPQYEYLDQPANDLASLHRQGAAIRQASASTRRQHGIGFYFSGVDSITPASTYTLDQLVARMHSESLRFR